MWNTLTHYLLIDLHITKKCIYRTWVSKEDYVARGIIKDYKTIKSTHSVWISRWTEVKLKIQNETN